MTQLTQKPARRSRTLWVFGSGLVGALTAIVMHYSEAQPLLPEAVSAAWATVISTALGILLRLATGQPIMQRRVVQEPMGPSQSPLRPPLNQPSSTGKRGQLIGIVLAVIGLSACGSTSAQLRAENAGLCVARCSAACAVSCALPLLDGGDAREAGICAAKCGSACLLECAAPLLQPCPIQENDQQPETPKGQRQARELPKAPNACIAHPPRRADCREPPRCSSYVRRCWWTVGGCVIEASEYGDGCWVETGRVKAYPTSTCVEWKEPDCDASAQL